MRRLLLDITTNAAALLIILGFVLALVAPVALSAWWFAVRGYYLGALLVLVVGLPCAAVTGLAVVGKICG